MLKQFFQAYIFISGNIVVSPKRINNMKQQNTGTVTIKKKKNKKKKQINKKIIKIPIFFFFLNSEITLKLHWVVDLMVKNLSISYSVQCYHAIWKDFNVYNLLLPLMFLFKCLGEFRRGTSAIDLTHMPPYVSSQHY